MMRGHSLISTHGGLLLLAVPFQILLVTIPLTLVMMIPESIVRLNRRLELAILLYIIGCSWPCGCILDFAENTLVLQPLLGAG